MSWESASREAQLWIDRKNFKNSDIAGTRFALEELFDGHDSEGRYRMMIYEAATRILRKRGANTNLHQIDIATGRPRVE